MIDLREFVKRLLEYDPDIVEVVQFGSSVYAPEYARDVDILVITRKMKEYNGYLDALNLEGSPINIDVLVLEVGKILKRDLLRSVLGSFRLLYGEGKYLLEYAKYLGDPTFEEARSSLRVAASLLKLALETVNPLDKDRVCREAFDALFHAARIASMVYLSTEISRWGLIKRELPEPYRISFNDFISTLHIKYFYNGEYPRENIEEEFNKWFRRVEEYISKLELEVKIKRK
ncbi:MAG: hypothetical protein NDF51_01750 [archaeon YNP-WB-040]|nr:hypothetical protein [Candidatus Culexarchaeum yellowstonense]